MTYPPALWRLIQEAQPEGLRKEGPDWKCRCPSHLDRVASLAIKIAPDGRLLLYCHAGCTTPEILARWGIEWGALFPDSPAPNGRATFSTPETSPDSTSSPPPNLSAEPEAVYDYVDEQGRLLFQVCRFHLSEGKTFRPRRPLQGGGWTWNMRHVRRVPYRLPDIAAASASTWVWVVEGEKDCDRLAAAGLVATTNPGGARKWTREHSQALHNRPVVVIPDNDQPGRDHAQQVAESLNGTASRVVVLELAGLPEHGDVSDWLDQGHNATELLELIKAAPTHTLTPEIGVLFASVEPVPITWLWPGYLARGKITVVVGPPGDGKTMVALDVSARITAGRSWPDGTLNEHGPGGIVYCSAEDDVGDTLLPRFLEAGGNPDHALALSTIGAGNEAREIYLPDDLKAIEQAIKRVRARLLVIDPWGGFLSGKLDGNYDQSVRQAMRPLKDMAERTEVAVLVVMHPNKNTSTTAMYRAGGSLGTVAAARIVFACGRDPENRDRRVIAPIKANLTAFPPSLGFTVTAGERAAQIEWESDPVSLTADDVLKAIPAADEKRPTAVGTAKAMLSILLADQALDREQAVQQIIDALGCSERTVKRAAKELNIRSKRTGFGESSLWMLPDFRAPDSQANETQSGQLGQGTGEERACPDSPNAQSGQQLDLTDAGGPTDKEDEKASEDDPSLFLSPGLTGPTDEVGPTEDEEPDA